MLTRRVNICKPESGPMALYALIVASSATITD